MKFEKKTLWAGGLVIMTVVVIAIKLSSDAIPETSPDHANRPVARPGDRLSRTPSPHLNPAPDKRPGDGSAATPNPPPAELEKARDLAIEKMQEAATSYDPAELPVIRPYLESPDPELREAAVDAMMVLGDASAGPMLREAAKKLDSIEESYKMVKAAEFLELPPADLKKISEKMKKIKEASEAAEEPPK